MEDFASQTAAVWNTEAGDQLAYYVDQCMTEGATCRSVVVAAVRQLSAF